MTDDPIRQAAALLRDAQHAVAQTGAGVSTPSGIPDFRSVDSGLWNNVDPFEVGSLVGFRRRPEAFFEWVRPLTRLILDAKPNPAHLAIAAMEQHGVIKALITQNIDMLHTRAGSHTIYEVHGHLREATCIECFGVYPTNGLLNVFADTGEIPHCPGCGAILKPNVILFGEAMPVTVLHKAQRAARQADVLIVAGTSLEVAPASEIPLIAHAHGAQVIIVNREPTYADSYAEIVIRDDVAHALPEIARLLED
jgi:NAD-dependent deacetylase